MKPLAFAIAFASAASPAFAAAVSNQCGVRYLGTPAVQSMQPFNLFPFSSYRVPGSPVVRRATSA